MGFEHGWNAIAGVRALDVTKWSDFKLILRQLDKPEARAMYHTITIDTVAIAWQLCEEFVCAQNGVQKIADIPWGAGYTACKKEFESCLRKITQMGYGLVIIAHVEERKEKAGTDANGDPITSMILGPAIPKRCYEIVNQIVDIIGYISIDWDKDGNSERWLYTRKTPNIMAGSRFKHLAPRIKFGYQELADAIGDAIDQAQLVDGARVTDDAIGPIISETVNFQDVRNEAQSLWNELVGDIDPEAGPTEEQSQWAGRIMKRIEMIFGQPKRLSEIGEDQVDLFQLVIAELRDLLSEKKAAK